MDDEAVRQLRMGIGWVFHIRGDAGWIVLDYWLDHIVSTGSYNIGWIISYRLDRIVLAGLYQETLDFMRRLVTGWMGRMD